MGGSQGIQGLLLAVKAGEGVSFRKRREATQGDVCLFFSFFKCYLFIFEAEFWFIVAQAGLKLLILLFYV